MNTAPAATLTRSIGGFGALMVTLSALSPTIGVFIVGSDVIHQAGTSVLLCFAAAALLGVLMANVYAELVSAFPEAGAEYTMVGRALGPTAAFAMLGLVLFGLTIALALSGLGTAGYLAVVAPGLGPVPTAMALVAIVTVMAIFDVKLNALVTGIFLATEIAALMLLTGLGLLHPVRSLTVALHPVMASDGSALTPALIPATLAVMGTAAAGAVYAFNGYGSVAGFGEELHDAPRSSARVIFWALGIAAVLQLLPLVAVITGAPDLGALIHAAKPLPAFIASAGGPVVATAMSLAVALAIFNSMIVVALLSGRVLFSTARDRCWPDGANRALIRLHPRFGSPWIATLVMGAIGIGWCVIGEHILLTIISGGIVVIYALLCGAVIGGRRRGTTAHAAYRMPFYPVIPIAALIALAGIVWTSLADAEIGRPGLLATGAIVLLSLGYYRLVLHGRGRWAHRGSGE